MDVDPITVDQLKQTKNGRWIVIEGDVGNVAVDLRTLHPDLRLKVSEANGVFIVSQLDRNNAGEIVGDHLVTTAQECDQRLVERVRMLIDPSYDLVAEIDRLDTEADKKREYEFHQMMGDQGERLAHALRAERGVNKDSGRSKRSWGKK